MLFDYKDQLKTGERCLYMWPSVPGQPRPRGWGWGEWGVGVPDMDAPCNSICPCVQMRKASY